MVLVVADGVYDHHSNFFHEGPSMHGYVRDWGKEVNGTGVGCCLVNTMAG